MSDDTDAKTNEAATNDYGHYGEFCKAIRAFDRGTWIGVVLVNTSSGVWDRREYLCGFPVTHRPLKDKVQIYDETTGETVEVLTAVELNRIKIRNLFWRYIVEDILPKLFFVEGFTTDEEKTACVEKVKKEWAEDFKFDFKFFNNAYVYVDNSKSPPDKNYAEIERIVSLDYCYKQKFAAALRRIIKKVHEVKENDL